MQSAKDKAQIGLEMLKEAILDYLKAHKEGAAHSKIVGDLGLESDFEGKQKNYLSWSILGLLVNQGLARYETRGNRKYYFQA